MTDNLIHGNLFYIAGPPILNLNFAICQVLRSNHHTIRNTYEVSIGKL